MESFGRWEGDSGSLGPDHEAELETRDTGGDTQP